MIDRLLDKLATQDAPVIYISENGDRETIPALDARARLIQAMEGEDE